MRKKLKGFAVPMLVHEIIITFGKYKGQSLTDIFHNDRSYIKYLRDKSKDTDIIKECEKLLAS